MVNRLTLQTNQFFQLYWSEDCKMNLMRAMDSLKIKMFVDNCWRGCCLKLFNEKRKFKKYYLKRL